VQLGRARMARDLQKITLSADAIVAVLGTLAGPG
jgi:hypothetical protein